MALDLNDDEIFKKFCLSIVDDLLEENRILKQKKEEYNKANDIYTEDPSAINYYYNQLALYKLTKARDLHDKHIKKLMKAHR